MFQVVTCDEYVSHYLYVIHSFRKIFTTVAIPLNTGFFSVLALLFLFKFALRVVSIYL